MDGITAIKWALALEERYMKAFRQAVESGCMATFVAASQGELRATNVALREWLALQDKREGESEEKYTLAEAMLGALDILGTQASDLERLMTEGDTADILQPVVMLMIQSFQLEYLLGLNDTRLVKALAPSVCAKRIVERVKSLVVPVKASNGARELFARYLEHVQTTTYWLNFTLPRLSPGALTASRQLVSDSPAVLAMSKEKVLELGDKYMNESTSKLSAEQERVLLGKWGTDNPAECLDPTGIAYQAIE